MAKQPWIVSLISTDYDLKDERKAVIHFLRENNIEVSAFEDPGFPVQEGIPSHENCIKALGRADLAILLIKERYGGPYYDNQGISITQAEYDAFIAEHEGELRNRTENGAGSDPAAGDGESPGLPTREDVENYLNSNDAIADQRRLLLESQRANVNSLQLRIDLLQGVLDNFLTGEATASLDNGEILKTYDETVNNTVARLQEQVTAIDERIKNGNVYSTMAGTVTAVNVTEGSTYTGQKVMIKTEGTRDQELRGTVSFVSPKAGSTTSGGGLSDLSGLLGGMSSSVGDLSALTGGSSSADYLIRITMDDWNERLRLGMNAKLSIITEESPTAMAVPYEAVHEREDGTKYIEVIDEEATAKNVDEKGHTTTVHKEIDVEVGIEGTYYVEILSDEVEEGMRVIVPAASGEETVDDLLNMIGSGVGV